MNQGTNLGSQTGRWIILAALVAVLGALLFLLPGVQAQDGTTIEYNENGTDPVVTLTANDPEDVDTIVWSLLTDDNDTAQEPNTSDFQDIDGDGDDDVLMSDTADAAQFSISSGGALGFKSPPNFEMPRGTALDTDNTNTYRVVVQASDGGTSNDRAEEKEYLTWFKVTVMVTDLEEDGSVSLSIDADPNGATDLVPLVQPQVSIPIVANLTDPDGPSQILADDITWRWYRTSDLAVEGDVILNDAGTAELDAATHTPRDRADANDVDMYLRVKATYEDRRGKRKTAEAVSSYPVLAAIVNTNTIPKFAAATAERSVREDASRGTEIGRPVTAVDPDLEKLSYTLVADDNGDNEDHVNSFKIDPVTGQITLNASLNFEGANQEYMFQVRATDSRAGNTDPHVMVTIRVIDLDEMPEIKPDSAATQTLIEHAGGNAIERGETVDLAMPVATYRITDDDEGTPVLDVSGADAAMFTFTYDAATTGTENDNDAVLAFKAKPDFESPGDRNTDNIYQVTLEADDGNNTGTLDVTVKVTNDEEEGEVTLSQQQPLIGQELTASVTDSDGGFGADGALTRLAWAWHVVDTTGDGDCPAADATDWEAIPKATAATFTPRAVDDGRCLRATATYLDRTFDYSWPPGASPTDDTVGTAFENTARVVSGVVREDPANTQPEFPNTVFRFLPEDTPDYKYVGEPVTATDADTGDVLTYTLDGTDKDSFYIANSDTADDDATNDVDEEAQAGQIRVKVLTDLDHETDSSYVVEVEATDSTSNDPDAFANTDVDIYVTDVDEKPDIWVMENGNRVRDEFELDYQENDDSPVLTLMASDPEGVRDIVWSLLTDATGPQNLGLADPDTADDVDADDVADHASFSISSSGVLSFKKPPSFEDESATGNDDIYTVVVQASDGGTTDDMGNDGTILPRGNLNWFKVEVTVEDEDEDGTISLAPADVSTAVLLQPQVNIGITASLTDPDEEVTGTVWKWERRQRGSAQWQTITGATTNAYTPQDEADPNNPSPPAGETNRVDVGDTLRVTATYSDRRSDGPTDTKTAQKIIENPVLGALDDNTAPAFLSATANRSVSENAPAGTAVGAPVSATDPDFETTAERNSRKVTYWLPAAGTDNSLFSIDPRSGQIKVVTPQDFEDPDGGGADNSTTYEVTVMATDSSAVNSEVLTVSIELVDEDEDPTIDLVTTPDEATALNAAITTTDPDQTVETVISHAGGNAIEFAENGEARVVTFTVSDQDGGTPAVTLSGTDSSRFSTKDFEGFAATENLRVAGNLVFKGPPDFRGPDGQPARGQHI